jgi:EAL domain-containing protein (putative c-di-GMP-specific phosphodiesterase class I)
MTAAVRAYLESLSRDPLREDLRVVGAGHVVGRFLNCEIDSAFQAIARLDDADTEPALVAVQALARVHAGAGAELSPWNLFALAARDDDLVLLDRRCRIVHTLNYFAGNTGEGVLLLNVHERLLAAVAVDHGRAFRRALDSLAIDVRRVVIVLPLLTEASLDLQCEVLASYRINGFRVAATADQPGLLSSLLARIPADAVRVEARHLARKEWNDAFDAARAVQAEIHATRVGDEAGRQRALALGATHWQGWHLARPESVTVAVSAAA